MMPQSDPPGVDLLALFNFLKTQPVCKWNGMVTTGSPPLTGRCFPYPHSFRARKPVVAFPFTYGFFCVFFVPTGCVCRLFLWSWLPTNLAGVFRGGVHLGDFDEAFHRADLIKVSLQQVDLHHVVLRHCRHRFHRAMVRGSCRHYC